VIALSVILSASAEARSHSKRSSAINAKDLAPLGQGEAMLHRKVNPRSVSSGRSPASLDDRREGFVHLSGVCTSAFGVRSWSYEKGYGQCTDEMTRNTSTPVNSYFGGAQRQAGVGLIISR